MREGFYKGYRFPIEIIRHCVWLHYRFSLSLRDISEMMAYRGVAVVRERDSRKKSGSLNLVHSLILYVSEKICSHPILRSASSWRAIS